MRDPEEGVSASGAIVTGARRDRVPSHFEPVLAAASDLTEAGDERVAVYLYGSVATGQARVPTSDVDLLTIDLDPDIAQAVGQELTDRFRGVCRAVEIAAGRASDYRGDIDAAYGNRVFLRHYCVHVSGPSHHDAWPDFPADVRAARGLNGDIAVHAECWRIALDEVGDDATLGKQNARKSLLAVAGLVSVHDNTWTAEGASSARRWAEIEPDLSRDLERLVTWIDGDVVPSRQRSAEMLDRVRQRTGPQLLVHRRSLALTTPEPTTGDHPGAGTERHIEVARPSTLSRSSTALGFAGSRAPSIRFRER